MAGSQIRCLESEEPYIKVTESNPEFYYCERQRLALEALLANGEEAFNQCLSREKLRPFLSEGELQELKATATAEELQAPPSGGVGTYSFGTKGSSLSYWPQRSDDSPPDLELGWPDHGAWKGITRAEVYTHPPGEGAPHIKELVRSCIQQAHKNLRVRTLHGCSFQSRSQKQITGTLKEKFLLVDGEIAITGSYSFTWTDARLNRHLVTRLTGEVTDAFDQEFRTLYAASCPLPALEMPPHLQLASVAPLSSTNGPDVAPYISVLDGVQLSHRIAERRSVAPQPVAKSRAGEWELVLASPATAEEPMLPASPPKASLRNRLAAWRGVGHSGGGQQGPPDGPSALSDIYRNVQRNRLSAAKTTGARPSKSLWDLSRLSQLSGSSTRGWGRNGIESAEEAKKWGYQVTPAKELMKHRGSGHVPEEPRMPFYIAHGRMVPSPGYIPLGRLQGQLYHKPPNIGLPRTWGHLPRPQYGHQPRF
ncbi:protein FAM83E isoform X2 [Crotalus tigris]|uniref:protein FAM83E isoform X2 n=1 Tax=Crotalus tigris TaxID=88082 RepID=UPI00192F1F3E|nr:protein FAM83E isoform X2 [Crotalus tigris]